MEVVRDFEAMGTEEMDVRAGSGRGSCNGWMKCWRVGGEGKEYVSSETSVICADLSALCPSGLFTSHNSSAYKMCKKWLF